MSERGIFTRLLPPVADNDYRAARVALWIFGFVLLVKYAMGLNSLFNGYNVLTEADGLPLAAYSSPAVQTITSIFALRALSQVIICVIGSVVIIRYRALVPLMFVLFLLEHLSRKLIFQFLPIPKPSAAPPAVTVNSILLIAIIVGALLSLWVRQRRSAVATP